MSKTVVFHSIRVSEVFSRITVQTVFGVKIQDTMDDAHEVRVEYEEEIEVYTEVLIETRDPSVPYMRGVPTPGE